jgi:hypothetical protein
MKDYDVTIVVHISAENDEEAEDIAEQVRYAAIRGEERATSAIVDGVTEVA